MATCHRSIYIDISGRYVYKVIIGQQLKIEGFVVTRWLKEWPECFKQMSQWISEVAVLVINSILIPYYDLDWICASKVIEKL